MEPQMLTGGLRIAVVLFIVILAILWFLLPFAVFGIKKRLDKIIDQNDQLIALLQMRKNTSETSKLGNRNERIEPTINL